MKTTFVGIGSGAIQLGLWAYYAFLEGAQIVLSEVDARKVEDIRTNKGFYAVNIACIDRIVPVRIGPVRIFNPNVPVDRERIVQAVAEASDIVTAVPSTSFYERGGIVQILKDGLCDGRTPVTIYASENQVGAAKALERLVYKSSKPDHVQFCETVIERMGGAHTDERLIHDLNLERVTPLSDHALLVEDFDKIITSLNEMPARYGYQTLFRRFTPARHIHVYQELKLLGHNAVHFVLGSIGKLKGYTYMSEYNGDPDYKHIGYNALLYETAPWFTTKHKASGEPVATDQGFKDWTLQLMRRIANPFLYDPVDRVVRDPLRKLQWNDRLTWSMREALNAGVEPKRHALGAAAAALLCCSGGFTANGSSRFAEMSRESALRTLETIWGADAEPVTTASLLRLIGEAVDVVLEWKRMGDPLGDPVLLTKKNEL